MAIRPVVVTMILALVTTGTARGSIRAYPLDERTVYSIRISPDAPTTCVFPGALTALEGAHIAAKAEDHPAVLLSYQPGAEFFSVRALKADASGALNVVYRGRVYVLAFATAPAPDRVVTFLDEPIAGGDRPSARTMPKNLRALMERAKHHARFTAKYPALASTIERAEPATTTHYRDFSVTIEEVFRFDAEDTLVFRVRLENSTDTPVRYDAQGLAVRIGTDVFPTVLVDASGAIPPRTATRVFFAVTGAPHGGRANLSVRELFSVIVPPV